jgi:hypothetical protein
MPTVFGMEPSLGSGGVEPVVATSDAISNAGGLTCSKLPKEEEGESLLWSWLSTSTEQGSVEDDETGLIRSSMGGMSEFSAMVSGIVGVGTFEPRVDKFESAVRDAWFLADGRGGGIVPK